MSTLPPVARSVYVFCKKCDTDRYFKVITHTSSTTAKMQCEVCKCHRNYSLGEEKKAAQPSVRRAGKAATPSAKASKATAHWLLLKEQYKGPQAVAYTINHQFKDKQSLEHPTFGLGFVTKTLPHKIEVVFEAGIKELMHGKK